MVVYIQGNDKSGPGQSPTREEIDANSRLPGFRKQKDKTAKPAAAVEAPVAAKPVVETTTRVMAAEPAKPSYRTRTVRPETKTDDENA